MSGEVFGQQGPGATTDEYNTMSFVFNLLLQSVQTATLVKVVSCTNNGGVSPVGTVTVQPLVNQMNGDGTGTPHGELYNALYARTAAGVSALIMDPEPDDIGYMGFCSRDISAVVAAMGQANPASKRMYDWADGVYVSATPLGITPTQFIQFLAAAGGINIKTPGTINLNGVTIDPEGNIKGPGSIIDGAGIVLGTHTHLPGTFNVEGTPVTGDSGEPVT